MNITPTDRQQRGINAKFANYQSSGLVPIKTADEFAIAATVALWDGWATEFDVDHDPAIAARAEEIVRKITENPELASELAKLEAAIGLDTP